MVTKRERGGRDKLGIQDEQIHTTIYKIYILYIVDISAKQ